jgi:endonuclease/exonuclease/phosphatase family metal-dependent hydrolase
MEDPTTRRRQADAVVAFIDGWRRPDEPVVLVGDLNARLGGDDLTAIEGAGWEPARPGSRSVLHVFLSPDDWDVVGNVRRGLGRSDHDAVWAILRMRSLRG